MFIASVVWSGQDGGSEATVFRFILPPACWTLTSCFYSPASKAGSLTSRSTGSVCTQPTNQQNVQPRRIPWCSQSLLLVLLYYESLNYQYRKSVSPVELVLQRPHRVKLYSQPPLIIFLLRNAIPLIVIWTFSEGCPTFTGNMPPIGCALGSLTSLLPQDINTAAFPKFPCTYLCSLDPIPPLPLWPAQ